MHQCCTRYVIATMHDDNALAMQISPAIIYYVLSIGLVTAQEVG